jgi:hypothetical protein
MSRQSETGRVHQNKKVIKELFTDQPKQVFSRVNHIM